MVFLLCSKYTCHAIQWLLASKKSGFIHAIHLQHTTMSLISMSNHFLLDLYIFLHTWGGGVARVGPSTRPSRPCPPRRGRGSLRPTTPKRWSVFYGVFRKKNMRHSKIMISEKTGIPSVKHGLFCRAFVQRKTLSNGEKHCETGTVHRATMHRHTPLPTEKNAVNRGPSNARWCDGGKIKVKRVLSTVCLCKGYRPREEDFWKPVHNDASSVGVSLQNKNIGNGSRIYLHTLLHKKILLTFFSFDHQFNDHDHDTAFTLEITRKLGFDLMT